MDDDTFHVVKEVLEEILKGVEKAALEELDEDAIPRSEASVEKTTASSEEHKSEEPDGVSETGGQPSQSSNSATSNVVVDKEDTAQVDNVDEDSPQEPAAQEEAKDAVATEEPSTKQFAEPSHAQLQTTQAPSQTGFPQITSAPSAAHEEKDREMMRSLGFGPCYVKVPPFPTAEQLANRDELGDERREKKKKRKRDRERDRSESPVAGKSSREDFHERRKRERERERYRDSASPDLPKKKTHLGTASMCCICSQILSTDNSAETVIYCSGSCIRQQVEDVQKYVTNPSETIICINTQGVLVNGPSAPTLETLEEFLRQNPGYQPVIDKNKDQSESKHQAAQSKTDKVRFNVKRAIGQELYKRAKATKMGVSADKCKELGETIELELYRRLSSIKGEYKEWCVDFLAKLKDDSNTLYKAILEGDINPKKLVTLKRNEMGVGLSRIIAKADSDSDSENVKPQSEKEKSEDNSSADSPEDNQASADVSTTEKSTVEMSEEREAEDSMGPKSPSPPETADCSSADAKSKDDERSSSDSPAPVRKEKSMAQTAPQNKETAPQKKEKEPVVPTVAKKKVDPFDVDSIAPDEPTPAPPKKSPIQPPKQRVQPLKNYSIPKKKPPAKPVESPMDRILDDVDTTNQHMSHFYDKNCGICRGRMDKTAKESLDDIKRQLEEEKRRVAELERLKRQAEEAAFSGAAWRAPPVSSSTRDSRPPPEPRSRQPAEVVLPTRAGFARTGAASWRKTAAPSAPGAPADDYGGDSPPSYGGGFDDDEPDTSILNYSSVMDDTTPSRDSRPPPFRETRVADARSARGPQSEQPSFPRAMGNFTRDRSPPRDSAPSFERGRRDPPQGRGRASPPPRGQPYGRGRSPPRDSAPSYGRVPQYGRERDVSPLARSRRGNERSPPREAAPPYDRSWRQAEPPYTGDRFRQPPGAVDRSAPPSSSRYDEAERRGDPFLSRARERSPDRSNRSYDRDEAARRRSPYGDPFGPRRGASPPRRAASPLSRDAPPCREGLSRVPGDSWRRDEPDERVESPDPWISEPTHTIWNGTFIWENQCTFQASYLAVSNKAAFDLASEMGHQARVAGRIQPDVFWAYIDSLKQSWNKQIIILLLETPREYREKYLMCHKIMLQEGKFASLDFKNHPTVKNGYLLPMIANDPWPYQLPLDGPGLPMSKHFDNILAVIVRNTPPKPPPTGARRDESWVRRSDRPVSSDRDPYSRSLSRDDARSRYSPDRQSCYAPRGGYSPASGQEPSGLRPPKQEIRDADAPAPLSRPPPPTRPPPQRDLSHVPPDPQSSASMRSYAPEARRHAEGPAGPQEDNDGLPIANTLQELLRAIEIMDKPGQISLMVRKFILAHPELSQREKESISHAIKQKSTAGRAGTGGANRGARLPPSQQAERGAPPPAVPFRQADPYPARQEDRFESRPLPDGRLDRDESRERSRPSSETRQEDFPRAHEDAQEPTHRGQAQTSSGMSQENHPLAQERGQPSPSAIKEERHLQAPPAPREPSPGTKLLQLSAAYERLRPESQTSDASDARATVSNSRPTSSRSQQSEPSAAPQRNSPSSYSENSRNYAPAQPAPGMEPTAHPIPTAATVGTDNRRPPDQPPPPDRESPPPPPPPPAQAGADLLQGLPPPPAGMAYTVTYVQTPNGPMPVLVPTPVSQASGGAPSAHAPPAHGAVASTSGTDMDVSDDDCLIPPPPPPPPMEAAPPTPATSEWAGTSDEFDHGQPGRPLRGLFGADEAFASDRQQFRHGPNLQRMPPSTMRYGQEEYVPYQTAPNNDPLLAPPGPNGPHSSNFGPPPPGPPPHELLQTAAAVMQAAFEKYETSYGVLREHAAPQEDRLPPAAYGRMPPRGPPPFGAPGGMHPMPPPGGPPMAPMMRPPFRGPPPPGGGLRAPYNSAFPPGPMPPRHFY